MQTSCSFNVIATFAYLLGLLSADVVITLNNLKGARGAHFSIIYHTRCNSRWRKLCHSFPSRLVRHAEGGSVRLFIINSGNLIQQLQLGGNLDCVYIAEDIGETSTLTAAPYNEAMPVSKVWM